MKKNEKSEMWQRIRAARLFSKVSQEQIGKSCNPIISKAAVANWENRNPDKRVTPRSDQLSVISELTRAPVEWLTSDDSVIQGDWSTVYRVSASHSQESPFGKSIEIEGDFIGIPVYDSSEVTDDRQLKVEQCEYLSFQKDWLQQLNVPIGELVILVAHDNELAPRINKEDVLLVRTPKVLTDLNQNLRDNAVYVINYFNEIKLRLIQKRLDGSVDVKNRFPYGDQNGFAVESFNKDKVGGIPIVGEVLWVGGTL
ncbi:MAG: helix-turn-helix transcriptional regulator [Methylococcales bacterium]|nr:helix-turn-helix transcriptional regulator [Methylococcales bacterium]MBT7443079.1 helix-turn-helix transcriptional regulator [Methylococcales bacterium]